jgi:MFS family permease
MNGLFSVGGFGGAMFVSWACDYLGRKKTLLVACPIAIAGGALQGSAVNIAMFLVDHLHGGFAVGALLTSVFLFPTCQPVFQAFLLS